MSSTPEGSKKRRGPYRGIKGKGFALITAILAVMILMALGILAINVSTGDLRTTARLVGEKRALAAAETGITRLMVGFNPQDFDHIAVNGVQTDVGAEQTDPADAALRYTVNSLGLAGYFPRDLVGFGEWKQKPYVATVTGSYGSSVHPESNAQITAGIGYAIPTAGTNYE